MDIVLGIILMVLAVVIVVSTVLQSEKGKGLSGVISGSASDEFSPKAKIRTRDKILSKVTLFSSIALAIVAIIMYVYVS